VKETIEEQLKRIFKEQFKKVEEYEQRTKDNTSKDGHQPQGVYRKTQVEASSRK